MNRFDRLIAILLHLQTKRVVRAQELAERYAVSVRTIYRDLRTLEAAGVPLAGETGSGFALAEGYRLPPVMFTQAEATALLTATKLAECFTDAATAHLSRAALDKVRAVLPRPDRDYLQQVSARVAVRHPVPSVASAPDVRQRLLTGVANRQVVWLTYRAGYGDQATERLVEPIGLYFALHWHLVAFCRLRQQARDFRLDRITELRVLDEQFTPRPDTLDSYWAQRRAQQPQHRVVLRFAAGGRARIRDDKYFFGWVAERELEQGAVEMTLLVPALRELAYWLVYFGDQVDIVSPPELQQAVLALLRTSWQHHAKVELSR